MLNLVIVGGTGSGKTSLMMRLNRRKRTKSCTDDIVSEISICNWKFSGDGGIVYFRIWDFPSQVCNIHLLTSLVAAYITYIQLKPYFKVFYIAFSYHYVIPTLCV